MSERFRGRTAIVSGAASGIGAATARRFARDGGAVVLLDIDESKGGRVAADIEAKGAMATFLAADVSLAATWDEAADLARRHHGGIDFVHSNAFLHLAGAPATLALDEWHRVIDVNLTALFLAAAATADDLSARTGSIVATSSVHGLMSLPDYTAYAAAKGGLDALVRQLAVQYAPQVRVNAVVPGPVDTGRWGQQEGVDRDSAGRATLLGRVGTADEVAAAVCFLASDEAAFITGASLRIDGGWSIRKDST